jgi:hypothetical protein
LLEISAWNKVGLNVSLTKENNPIFLGKDKNTEKTIQKDKRIYPTIVDD